MKVEATVIFRLVLTVMICALCSSPALAQVIRPVRQFNTSGKIKAVKDGTVAITDRTGKSWQMRYTLRDDGRLKLNPNAVFTAQKADIRIVGAIGPEVVEKGYPIRVETYISDEGKLGAPVTKIAWADKNGFKPGVRVDRKKKDDRGLSACIISGNVEDIRPGRLTLKLPRSRFASKGRMTIPLSKDVKVTVATRDMSRVREGDQITEVAGVVLSTGDYIASKISIQMADGSATKTKGNRRKPEPAVETVSSTGGSYDRFSDDPVAPRELRSQHYLVKTDLSDRKARMLLDKLETMLALVSRYYGRLQTSVVQCYVVDDPARWSVEGLPPKILEKIKKKEGTTLTKKAVASNGMRASQSVIYSCGDAGVVQHEAVHAYCHSVFGDTGPTWYSEGMAEMGQYWKDGIREVDVDPRVLSYLRKAEEPKKLAEIVKQDQITGDSWEAYAWRWALCHLLANNPNYNRKFRDLGMGLMAGQSGVSFGKAYGSVAKQLTFEYDHFVRNVSNGYRADLCAWRWKHRFKDLEGSKPQKFDKILAKAGWQPTINVQQGIYYDCIAKGEWTLDGTGEKATADGIEAEEEPKPKPTTKPKMERKRKLTRPKSKKLELRGQLLGVIMQDYQLGEPFQIGAKGSFVAESDGQLYVRCGEPFGQLGDNKGTMTIYLRRSARKPPSKPPTAEGATEEGRGQQAPRTQQPQRRQPAPRAQQPPRGQQPDPRRRPQRLPAPPPI